MISWKRAVTLLFLGKAEVVNEYHREVRSVSLCIKVPAVVRLLTYVKLGRRKPPLSKANLLARDESSCQYCGDYLTRGESTIDHVIPRSHGGLTKWDNVVIACADCNRKKGGRNPQQARMKLRCKPIAPEWLPVLSIRLHSKVPEAWLVFLR